MRCVRSVAGLAFAIGLAAAASGQVTITSVYQGGQASDAFSAIHYVGAGRVIAGKRSSNAGNRFLLSTDEGVTWSVVGCPGSTGAHTYFFGQRGDRLFAGTGDTGQACLMRSDDRGDSWSVALSASQLAALVGSSDVRAVFGPVPVGTRRWLVNLKTLDTPNKVVASLDDGATWFVPPAQPGLGASSWARQMIATSDGVLLWPDTLSDRMYRSEDLGLSWSVASVPGARLFQPLCDLGDGIYMCGDATTAANGVIRLHRSTDRGLTWSAAHDVNLQRPTPTYWRDVLRVGDTVFASACCHEGTSSERFMQLHVSRDRGRTWTSLGNPYIGPFGGMQAIYQMCENGHGGVFAACQPDSNILHWQMPSRR